MILPNFVVVEGLDGVGKTTLAKFLQDKLGYIYMYSLPQRFIDLRHELLASANGHVQFLYYLSGVVAVQDELREHLKQGNRVVMDRYIYTTLAYHQALRVDTTFVSLEKLPIIWPDRCILLIASEETRLERLYRRKGGVESKDINAEFTRLAQEALFTMLSSSVVDTDKKSAHDVFEEVKSRL